MEYRTLEITLHGINDLNKPNSMKNTNLYVVVSITGGDKNSKTKTTVIYDGDANSPWNFPMTFTVDEAALQANRLTLDFKLVRKWALKDIRVGQLHVPVKELLDSPASGGAGAVKNFVIYQLRREPCGKTKGEVAFSFLFSEKTVRGAAAASAPLHELYPPSAPPYPEAEGCGYHFPPPPHGGVHDTPPDPGRLPTKVEGSGYWWTIGQK